LRRCVALLKATAVYSFRFQSSFSLLSLPSNWCLLWPRRPLGGNVRKFFFFFGRQFFVAFSILQCISPYSFLLVFSITSVPFRAQALNSLFMIASPFQGFWSLSPVCFWEAERQTSVRTIHTCYLAPPRPSFSFVPSNCGPLLFCISTNPFTPCGTNIFGGSTA